MSSARDPVTVRAAACGLLAGLLTAVAMAAVLRPAGWSLTALPLVDSTTALGREAHTVDPSFHTVHPGAYDGQFYWAIAVDPLATGDVHRAVERADSAPYRYGHPLYGWLGWLGSAGQARAAPAALAAVGLASMIVAAAAASALGVARGRGGWEGLFVALNPGLVYGALYDLAEPLAAALLLATAAAYVHERRRLALACAALLPLAKEPLVLVPIAIAAWELTRGRRRRAAPFAASVAPAVAWWVYERVHLGHWFTFGSNALGSPLYGWRRALLDNGVGTYSADAERGQIALVVLVPVLALLALAALRALRSRGPFDLAYVALAVVAACLAPNATVALRDALRNTAVLVAFVPFVIASPRLVPRSWAPRAAGSSTAPPASPP